MLKNYQGEIELINFIENIINNKVSINSIIYIINEYIKNIIKIKKIIYNKKLIIIIYSSNFVYYLLDIKKINLPSTCHITPI